MAVLKSQHFPAGLQEHVAEAPYLTPKGQQASGMSGAWRHEGTSGSAFQLLVTGSARVSRVGRRQFVCGTQDDKGGRASAAAGHTRADCRDPGTLAVKYFPSLLVAAVNGSHIPALMAHRLHTRITAYPTSQRGNLIGILKSVCQQGPSPSVRAPHSRHATSVLPASQGSCWSPLGL